MTSSIPGVISPRSVASSSGSAASSSASSVASSSGSAPPVTPPPPVTDATSAEAEKAAVKIQEAARGFLARKAAAEARAKATAVATPAENVTLTSENKSNLRQKAFKSFFLQSPVGAFSGALYGISVAGIAAASGAIPLTFGATSAGVLGGAAATIGTGGLALVVGAGLGLVGYGAVAGYRVYRGYYSDDHINTITQKYNNSDHNNIGITEFATKTQVNSGIFNTNSPILIALGPVWVFCFLLNALLGTALGYGGKPEEKFEIKEPTLNILKKLNAQIKNTNPAKHDAWNTIISSFESKRLSYEELNSLEKHISAAPLAAPAAEATPPADTTTAASAEQAIEAVLKNMNTTEQTLLTLRETVLGLLNTNEQAKAAAEPLLDAVVKKYVEFMSTDGNWGGHLELATFANRFNCTVEIKDSRNETTYKPITPINANEDTKTITIAYTPPIHYDAYIDKEGTQLKHVEGDGNCLFRALIESAVQQGVTIKNLPRDQEGHFTLRQEIVKQFENGNPQDIVSRMSIESTDISTRSDLEKKAVAAVAAANEAVKAVAVSTKEQYITIYNNDPRHFMTTLNPDDLFQKNESNYTKTNGGELQFNTDFKLNSDDSRYPKIVKHCKIDHQKLQTKTKNLTKLDNQFTFKNNANGDSMQEAATLQSHEKLSVFVMNPANATKPGGGACDGKPHRAMEENICRNSDLLSSLAHVFNEQTARPYLPTATQAIVSTNAYKFESGSKKLNFLSIASPDLKKSEHHTGYHRNQFDTNYGGIGSDKANEAYKNLMKQYWTTALAATIEHANDSTTPVLVATPPGDYLKTHGEKIDDTYVKIAAEALKDAIEENPVAFKTVQIVFARKTDQTDIFSDLLLNQHYQAQDSSASQSPR